MFEFDKETNKIKRIFKTVIDKEFVAKKLAESTVHVGLQQKSEVLYHFYGENEPDFVTSSCISYGLINFFEADFYIVKEVLGCKKVKEFLEEQSRYIKIV